MCKRRLFEMAEKEYIIDDRWELPEKIKNMTKEELEREITRLEQEIKDKKRKAQNKDIAV